MTSSCFIQQVVNGHSYKELKSNNTNLAILCSHNFTEPFNQPIEYAQKIGELRILIYLATVEPALPISRPTAA